MVDILNWLIGVLADLVEGVMSILPSSPFTWDISSISPILAITNFFVPIPTLITILGGYVVAVASWYAIRWILRIAKYIQ